MASDKKKDTVEETTVEKNNVYEDDGSTMTVGFVSGSMNYQNTGWANVSVNVSKLMQAIENNEINFNASKQDTATATEGDLWVNLGFSTKNIAKKQTNMIAFIEQE
tara:strand:- start:23 stop:340 length:318 start_codon:yes stop_codon:yes gene_type:complete